MVDRQYEIMRRERARLTDEPHNMRNTIRHEDSDMSVEPQPAPNTATEAQMTEQEVRFVRMFFFFHCCVGQFRISDPKMENHLTLYYEILKFHTIKGFCDYILPIHSIKSSEKCIIILTNT